MKAYVAFGDYFIESAIHCGIMKKSFGYCIKIEVIADVRKAGDSGV